MLKSLSGAMQSPIAPRFAAGTIVTGGTMPDAKLMRHRAPAWRACALRRRESAAVPDSELNIH